MKEFIKILSNISGYSVEELTERNTDPIIQPEDCLKAMKKLEKQAIGIVAQLFDLAEVPVDKRQEINAVAYDYVTEQLIIADVVSSFTGKEKTAFLIGYQKGIKARGVDVLNKDK